MHSIAPKPTEKPEKPRFVWHKVAQNLFRVESSRGKSTYYLLTKVGGKQIRRSLETSDRKEADRKLRVELAILKETPQKRGRMPFKSLLEKFEKTVLSARDLKPRSKEFRKLCNRMLLRVWKGLGDLPVRDLAVSDCQQWIAKRRRQVCGGRLNSEIDSLRMILDFGVKEGCLFKNPAAELEKFQVSQPKIIVPAREHLKLILNELEARKNREAAEMIQLLAFSGMRQVEASELRWCEIDFLQDRLTITGGAPFDGPGTKNREERTIPLFAPLKAFLEQLKSRRGGNPPAKEKVLRIAGCLDGLQVACRALNLPKYNHHTWRHFFVTECVEVGIDFKTISVWCGHKDGGILIGRVYGHLRSTHETAMASKLTFGTEANNNENRHDTL